MRKIKTIYPLVALLSIGVLTGCAKDNSSSSDVTSSSVVSSSISNTSASSNSSVSSTSSEEAKSESSVVSSSSESISEVTKYAVTYVHLDGTSTVKNVEENAKAPELEENTNFEFAGWYDNDGNLFDFDSAITGNVTLTAKQYAKVSFKGMDDYLVSLGFINWNALGTKVDVVNGVASFTLPSVHSRLGTISFDVFDKSGAKIGTYNANDEISLSSSVTIAPKGTVKTVTVTFEGIDDPIEYNFEQATIAVPSYEPDEEEAYFVGWKLDDEGQVFRPGDLINTNEISDLGNITFNKYVVDDSDVLVPADFDELIYSSCDYEVIVLEDDIDADGADTDTGIGDGEWNGVILGNGHTISNFTIDCDDTAVNSGLIDYSSERIEVYDLNLSDITLSSYSSYGAGALIGEADGIAIFNNVNVSNLTLDVIDTEYWSSHVYDSSSMQIVERESPINNSIRGLGGIIGTYAALDMKNCSVDEFDTTIADYTDNEISSSITIGGLAGGVYDNELETYDFGTHISGCSVTHSNIYAENMVYGAVLGGLVGNLESIPGRGISLYSNKVSSTTIEAKNCSYNNVEEDGSAALNYVGGISGYAYISEENMYGENEVVNEISFNSVSATVKVTFDDEELANNYHCDVVGGLFGEIYTNLGSNNKDNCGLNISENYFVGKVIENTINLSIVRVGGLAGYIGFDNEHSVSVIVSNNLIDANINVSSTAEYLFYDARVGGLIGYAATGADDETFATVIDSNVVLGKIVAPEVRLVVEDGLIKNTMASAGLIAVLDHDLGHTFITNNLTNVNVTSGNKVGEANFYFVADNVVGDSESSELVISGNMTQAVNLSVIDNQLGVKQVSYDSLESFYSETGLLALVWELDGNTPVLNVMMVA